MVSREVTILHHAGLHARAATFFIQRANNFKSNIWVLKDTKRVNAKSLLGVLSLGISQGMVFKIAAEGSDEEAALQSLYELVLSNFKEDDET